MNELKQPKKDEKYAIIVWKDVKTGLILKDQIPQLLRSVTQDISMYYRHLSKDQINISYEVLESDTYDTLIKKPEFSQCKYLINDTYRPNPFNSELNETKYSYITIPAIPDDPRDTPWLIRCDHKREEQKFVKDKFNDVCINIYFLSTSDVELKSHMFHKIHGTCCNVGYINYHFDYHKCSGMSLIRNWIEMLHSTSNLKNNVELITENGLKTKYQDNESIYKGRFYTSEVQKLSEYCEEVFGVSRFIVATYFEKSNPEIFMKKIGQEKNLNRKGYYLIVLASIYAELDDYSNALKTYIEALDTFDNPDHGWKCHLEKFKEYYNKNGTTILSSNL